MSDWVWIGVGWAALFVLFAAAWVVWGRGRSERAHALDEMVRAELARRERSET